jgi:hypothetical protein
MSYGELSINLNLLESSNPVVISQYMNVLTASYGDHINSVYIEDNCLDILYYDLTSAQIVEVHDICVSFQCVIEDPYRRILTSEWNAVLSRLTALENP